MNGLVGSMEKYVVRLKVAKLLKHAGYPQSAEYLWIESDITTLIPKSSYNLTIAAYEMNNMKYEVIAAPLIDELLESEMMPNNVIIMHEPVDGDVVYYGATAFKGQWRDSQGWHQTLANALAQLWLWNSGVRD